MGDPGGIGPEVIVKALADPALRGRARWIVLGPSAALERAAEGTNHPKYWGVGVDGSLPEGAGAVVVLDRGGGDGPFPARATREGGEISFRLVEEAIAMAKRPAGDPL